MSPREVTSDHGLVFSGNSLYEVLLAIAARRRERFHGAMIARDIGRTDAQTLAEIAKLANVGVLREVGQVGRCQQWVVRRSSLARCVLNLPGLLEKELGKYPRPLPMRTTRSRRSAAARRVSLP